MNKTFIAVLLCMLVTITAQAQASGTHSINVQLRVWFKDTFHSFMWENSHEGDTVIGFKIGYSYLFDNGFMLGASIPVEVYGFARNELYFAAFPIPSILCGYGDRESSFALSGEFRFAFQNLIDISEPILIGLDANVYYRNVALSMGYELIRIIDATSAFTLGSGYSWSFL